MIKEALRKLEFAEHEENDMFSIIAAILHLGNIGFGEEEGVSTILKPDFVQFASEVRLC